MRYAILVSIVFLIGAGIFFYVQFLSKSQPVPANLHTVSHSSPGHSSTLNNQSPAVTISKGDVPKIPFNIQNGLTIHVFASRLGKARDLQFSPGGTLLVSDPSAGKVYALPDKNNDGVADETKVVLETGGAPHGLAFYNGKLYIAFTTHVARFNWDENTLKATLDTELFTLPSNDDHNLRTLTFDKNGQMYVSVGSTCNVCHEASELSATVITSDADGGNMHVFAKGLRNAPFIQFNPKTQELWGTEMGRDNLGDNIPPDEINIIKENQNYGWPNCYADKIHDTNFDHNQYIRDPCADTIAPIFQIPAHSAPLGWTFINSNQFPADWQGDMLVSYHGSWNRSTPIGYKVVHLKVSGNSITNAEDFLTGFLPSGALIGPSQASGRPVDLTFDSQGNLFLSDDKNGTVYIIQKQ
jgi:glucose/arabinose dehydrogenase